MPVVFFGILALLALLLLSGVVTRTDPRVLARVLKVTGGVVCLVAALAFLLTGRWALALPLGMAGWALLSGRPLSGFSPFGASARKSPGQSSTVRTAFLEMTLDHDTGDMHGRVRSGRYEDQDLASLGLVELLDLRGEAAGDAQSSSLLETYLDRRFPEWRAAPGYKGGEAPADGGNMTREEALSLLGLEEGASEAEIKRAHRLMMKRHHPDQGGSDHAAARINRAKEMLLGG